MTLHNNFSFKLLFSFLIIFFSIHCLGQDVLKSKDLSTVKIDMLSDEEILRYKQQLQQSGLSESQAEQLAIQKGMSSSEITKLRARLSMIETSSSRRIENSPNNQSQRNLDSSYFFNQNYFRNNEKNTSNYIYGSELFNNSNLTFEPNLRIATPKNYVVGPDDELIIDVFGFQEVNYKVTVSAEGNVSIPNVGLVPVNGLTIEQASLRIKNRMIKSGYGSIQSSQSQIQVSVGKIRSIRVTIIGEVKRPGSYTLSSLSTLFNALYASGGPTEKGSFRAIEVIRNGVVYTKMDAYDFLSKGDQTKNIRLSDQDIIRIPFAKVQIVLRGEINKPAIFEVAPNEKLNDIINYAGNFSSAAYTASVHIIQLTDKDKKVKDVSKEEFKNYIPSNGDEIIVSKILDKFNNRIKISGAVYRPGFFELTDKLTLSQLIKKADGIREDAFIQRGEIIRVNKNTLIQEIIPFNPLKLDSAGKEILLEKDDEIIVGSYTTFKDSSTVTIEGEVRKPGIYPYYNKKSLKDLFFETGGLTDVSAVDNIEIARRIEADKLEVGSKKLSEVIQVSIDKNLDLKSADILLKPWDVVMVRSKPGYKPQITVRIQGEVQYPGSYILATKEDRVSELIKRSGGLTAQAFKSGINISRINKRIIKDTSDFQLKKIQQQTKDSSNSIANDYARPTVTIGLDIEKIISNPNGPEDILLQEGDVLNIPKEKREIKVSGEVLFPAEVVYEKGKSLKYYIDKAGGYTDNARKRKVYVLKPNGVAARTKHFLFVKQYPKVPPGAEILVPSIPEHKNSALSAGEFIAIASALASIAGVAVAIINVTKK